MTKALDVFECCAVYKRHTGGGGGALALLQRLWCFIQDEDLLLGFDREWLFAGWFPR